MDLDVVAVAKARRLERCYTKVMKF